MSLRFKLILFSIVALLARGGSGGQAADRVIWTIGKADNSAGEFAQGWYQPYAEPNPGVNPYVKGGAVVLREEPGPGLYPHAKGRPVIFTVGTSTEARDWPAVQPADYDPLGAATLHPFTILFSLADKPRGTYALRIDAFFDNLYYPDLELDANGHHAVYFFHPQPIPASSPYWKRSGYGYIMATDRLEATIPASLLHTGENQLVLTANHGMHFEYDDLEFVQLSEKSPPAVDSVRFEPTVLYRDEPLNPEVARLFIRTTHISQPMRAEIHIGQFAAEKEINPGGREFGDFEVDADIPSTLLAQPAHLTVGTRKDQREFTVAFTPAKKWTVYAAPTSHDDVGFRETQPRTREWLEKEVDDWMALRKQFPWYKLNLENSWTATDFLAHRSAKTREEFFDLARHGDIGINALYANLETGMRSPEEFARALYNSAAFHRSHGVPMDAATETDVPSYTGALPTFLASAGIKFFAGGANQDCAPMYRNAKLAGDTPLNLRSPFWWEGPDGSRVLTWMSLAYAQVGRMVWGYPRHDMAYAVVDRRPSLNLDVVHKSLPLFLTNYTRADYPYDAILLFGLYGDDHSFGDGEASIIAEWNRRYAYPKIVLSRFGDFGDHILKSYSGQIPVIKGDMGTYWGRGYGAGAREAAWDREAQVLLPAAEEFGTIASLLDPRIEFPLETDRQGWTNLLRFEEHTWDDEYADSRPDSQRSEEEWRWKRAMPRDALLGSQWLLEQVLEQLRNRLGIPYETVAVFNPLSWARSGPVEVELNRGETLTDPVNGGQVPYAIVGQGHGYVLARFWASEVPAVGFKVYHINLRASAAGAQDSQVSSSEESSPPSGGDVISEGKFYRIVIDAKSGAVKSLVDRRSGQELVDTSATFGLNEYRYVLGGEGSSIMRDGSRRPPELQISGQKAVDVESVRVPWGTKILVTAAALHTPEISSEIDLLDATPRIDITDRVRKDTVLAKEAAYFAFPFRASHPTITYQLAAGWFRPNQDQVAGAAKEWFGVQNGIKIVAGDTSVLWATRDAPLATLQDIDRGRWPVDLPIRNGWIFSWVMNNYWFTNYPSSQGGDFTFRYSLTSGQAITNSNATRFGMEARQPLIPLVSRDQVSPPFGSSGEIPKPEAGFVHLSPDNVVLLTLKPAEAGGGLIARLQEIGGESATAHLEVDGAGVTRADLCNLVEENQRVLPVTDGRVEVPLPAYGIATVRLERVR